jgi:acetyltransferase-like isoleucine patch superfamily enzyme
MTRLEEALANPRLALATMWGRARGAQYKLLYRLLRKNVRIGRNLVVHGRLSIRGPGRVEIGDDVQIRMTVTPWTQSKGAVIAIGSRTFLNGSRISCQNRVEIGEDCIFADCRILDSDFHGSDPEARDRHRPAAVVIENNVWLAINAVVLKGVRVGQGSTVTPNSVVVEDVPPRVIYGGNPGRILKQL